MANPKRKHSRMRTSKRRAHWKTPVPSFTACPQCREPKQPHRVCPSCGFYNNTQVLAIKKKKSREGEQSSEKEAT